MADGISERMDREVNRRRTVLVGGFVLFEAGRLSQDHVVTSSVEELRDREPVTVVATSESIPQRADNFAKTPVAFVADSQPLLNATTAATPQQLEPAGAAYGDSPFADPVVQTELVLSPPGGTQPRGQPTQFPQPRPYNAAPQQAPMAATPASVPRQNPLVRHGLPEGRWVRDSGMLKVVSEVSGKTINLTVTIPELAGAEFRVKAEYDVASDGTIFGLVHGIDIDNAALVVTENEELAVFGMLHDLPFTMRVHSDETSVTVKKLTLGVPTIDGSEVMDGEIPQAIQSCIRGVFKHEPNHQA